MSKLKPNASRIKISSKETGVKSVMLDGIEIADHVTEIRVKMSVGEIDAVTLKLNGPVEFDLDGALVYVENTP